MKLQTWIGVTGAALITAGAASGQTYTEITGFTPRDMSGDGSTLVGSGDIGAGFEAVSHDIATATSTGLGEDGAECVNFDGTAIGGEIAATSNGGYYDGSMWTDMGTLNTMGLSCGGGSVPNDISGDGSRLVGSDWDSSAGNCDFVPYFWEPGVGTLNALPKLGSGSARADVVNNDGTVVGGYERFVSTFNQAAIWVDNGSGFAAPTLIIAGIDFGDGNLDGAGVVTALSPDGSIAAVEAGFNSAPNVKVWDNGTVFELPEIPGLPGARPTPTGVSSDGSMIVGFGGGGGPFGPPPVGFVWTESGGMQTADSFFAANGVPLPLGFASTGVSGMSDDGKTLWGTAGAFPFFSYWVVELEAWTTYGLGAGGSNVLTLDGSGSTSVSTGGPFSLDCTGIEATQAFCAFGVSLSSASLPLFGGTLLINPLPGQLQGGLQVAGAAGGASSFSPGIPVDPNLAGLAVYAQAGAQDTTTGTGWALSNGLRIVLCD